MIYKQPQQISIKKNQWIFFSGLLVLFCIVYAQLLNAGFVSWDDGEVLLNNKAVHSFDIKDFFTKYYVGNYAPITMLSFSIDWFLFHGNSMWHHVVNIALHFINAYLVFCITKHIFKQELIAFACTAIFVFHPLQIETVAWISAKNNLLYGLFYLLALLMYLKYKATNCSKYIFYSFLLFVCSALSKPSAICFPVMLFAFDVCFDSNFKLKNKLYQIPFVAVTIIIAIVTLFSRTEDNFINAKHAFAVYERVGYAGYAIAHYIYHFFAPINLSVIYPYPQNKLLSIGIGYTVLVILGIVIYKLFILKKDKALFGILFFIVNLLLVLQFIPFGETLTADRYMYLPIIGLCWAFFSMVKLSASTLKIVTIGAVFLFCCGSFTRTKVWKNSVSLYSDIIKTYPHSVEALGSLGAEYMLTKNYTMALSYLNKAVAENKNYYKSYYNRGLVYAQTNKANNAIADFSKAIELKNYYKAYVARANVYYMLKDYPKAIADADKAIALDKRNVQANYILANCYDDLNQLDNAIQYYNTAILLNPDEALFYLRRAIVYGKKKEYNASLNDLNICIQINPKYAEAYYWKGVVNVNLEKNPCNEFNQALQLGFMQAQQPLNMYCK